MRIANSNFSNWFTAPPLPGNWYNYTVSLYGVNGTLLEKQYSDNCTTIGGLDLFIPNMTIENGRDALTAEIVDISFLTSAMPLFRGYSDELPNGTFYTEIQIGFENWNAFQNLLYSNNTNQTLVGCVTSGLPFSREIECMLRGGWNIEHEPIIRISGYDWVPAHSLIKVSLSNILQLNTTNRNTLYVSVLLKQVGSWKQGYLYNPQQLILRQTYPLLTTSFGFISLGYIGINTVGRPSSFSITITPNVNITTYFVIKFPADFISNEYELFNVSCSSADRIEVFFRSDIVRIYPLNGIHKSGVSVNYTITGFPSSQYSFSFAVWPILV